MPQRLRPLFLGAVLGCAVAVLLASKALAEPREDARLAIQDLQRLETTMRERTLPLLVLLRRLETSAPQPRRVRVIRDRVNIREADTEASRELFVAQRNDEFPVLEQRDRWIRVRLEDGREGWVRDDLVQMLGPISAPRASGPAPTPAETTEIVELAGNLLADVDALYDSSKVVLQRAREAVRQTPEPEKRQLQAQLDRTHAEIEAHRAYAHHFHQKYAANQPTRGAAAGLGRTSRGIDGQVAIRTGRTSYDAGTDEDQFSRDVDFQGGMQLSERSRLTTALSHRNEIIQTPYGTTDLRIGHQYAMSNQGRLNSYVAGNFYDDRASARNSFSRLGAGIAHQRVLSESRTFTGALDVDTKGYDEDDTNGYKNAQVTLGLRRKQGGAKQFDLGLRSMLQSSDASFLSFHRVLPSATWRRGGSIIKTELEWIGFASEAKGNSFAREELSLGWTRGRRTYGTALTAKQFPDNDEQSYVKLGGQTGSRASKPGIDTRTDLSLLGAYFTSGSQSHYFDLRGDRATTRGRQAYDASVFGRVWTDPDAAVGRDHVVDLQGRWNYAFRHVRVGPVVGAHLALNKGRKVIRRDGNDVRVGLEISGEYVVRRTPIHAELSYEKDFVYGNEITVDPTTGTITTGALVQRRPTTTQLSGGATIPIRRDLDLTIDLNRYAIDPDVTPETSLNPVESRKRFAITARLGYRFGL